jgi:hypothetical protein
MDSRQPKALYLVTEPDGVTPVGLWSKKWELGVFLRDYQRMGYRVFLGRDGLRGLTEVIAAKIMEA